MSSRHFDVNSDAQTPPLDPSVFKQHATEMLTNLVTDIDKHMHTEFDSDYSVYTGIAGAAYAMHKLSQTVHDATSAQYKEKAVKYADLSLKLCRKDTSNHPGILDGRSGPIAVSALVHSENDATVQSLTNELLEISSSLPDDYTWNEVLYGRAGYILSLLTLRGVCNDASLYNIDNVISHTIDVIMNQAQSYGDGGLLWPWHDSAYLGAAHGTTGILYAMLSTNGIQKSKHFASIIKCCQWLHDSSACRYDSGNYRSSIGSRNDKLVQWCHGAPGVALLFCKVYEILNDKTYLDWTCEAGDIVYSRGLLIKGPGLCHGVSGNAYVFMRLYNITHDDKWLSRAQYFVEYSRSLDDGFWNKPDHPWSLFEGMGGMVCVLCDMIKTDHRAKFPCFDI